MSCSNENDEAITDENNVNFSEDTILSARTGTLAALYDDMVASQSYIDFKVAAHEFIAKMNYSGRLEDIDTDQKKLNWIEDNLSTTQFTDLAEAEDELAEVNRLSLIAVDSNRDFYDALEGETPRNIKGAISVTEPPSSTNNHCTEVCIPQFKATMDDLTSQYTASIAATIAYIVGGGNGAVASKQLSDAQIVFVNGSQVAANVMVQCCLQ